MPARERGENGLCASGAGFQSPDEVQEIPCILDRPDYPSTEPPGAAAVEMPRPGPGVSPPGRRSEGAWLYPDSCAYSLRWHHRLASKSPTRHAGPPCHTHVREGSGNIHSLDGIL